MEITAPNGDHPKHHRFQVHRTAARPKGSNPHNEVFKDNSGALEIGKNHKYRPRTKHISVKLHHFRDYVAQGEIKISKIDMLKQLANILTKPVGESILVPIQKKILGW